MNKKGFSFVELLAVIVILGAISVIAIVAVSRYISSSKTEKVSQSKKNVAMATELYIQANREFAPKAIGESTVIPLSTLKNKNYIKDDLTNEAGEDCMEKSFVRVYKLSIEEYSYTTYLYCGKETVPTEIEVPEPVVFDFKFTGGTKNASGQYSSVKDAKFSFKMKGARNDSTVGIYSYSYSIFTKSSESDSYVEVYNSGSIKGNFQTSISTSEKSLADYIDVTGTNNIRVDVIVINEQGGRVDYSTEEGSGNGSFQDTDKPVCGAIDGNASDINDWINKESYGANGSLLANQTRVYPARITVNCNDSNGSGCKRDKFSKTWPNEGKSDSGRVDYKYGAIWSYIEIEDNAQASNKAKCPVHVNVDLRAPSINVEVYKAKADGTAGQKVYSTLVQEGSAITANLLQGTIHANDYSGLIGQGEEKWMNKQNYPYGIVIKVKATDNLGLKTWRFEANDANVKGGTNDATVSSSSVGEDNATLDGNNLTSGVFEFDSNILNSIPQSANDLENVELYNTNGNLPDLRLNRDGKRYGKITVCDYAGNCSIVHLYANIDLTPPKAPTINYVKNTSNAAYSPATSANYKDNNNWSNETIKVVPVSDSGDVSVIDYYEYSYKKQKGKSGTTYTWNTATTGKILYSGSSQESFTIGDEGIHKFKLKSCDTAGNCTSYSTEDYIKIDTIKPTCDLASNYQELSGESYVASSLPTSGWLKKGQRVILSHSCKESNENLSSGCDSSSSYNKQSFMYDFDINTTQAGANGYPNNIKSGDNTIGGHVIDYAGNMSDECPKMTVKIDTVPPTCTTSISYPNGAPIRPTDSSKPETGWLGEIEKVKRTAVVGKVCDDSRTASGALVSVSSGCDNDNDENKKTTTYNTEMIINNAGANGIGKGGKIYDIAGNSSVCPADRTVQIDYTAPKCGYKTEYGKGTSASTFVLDNSIKDTLIDGWLGWDGDSDTIKRMAKVSLTCEDNGTIQSGCYGSYPSKIYDFETNDEHATVAVSGDEKLPVVDNAGNYTTCESNEVVRIDYTRPACEVTASSTGSSTVNGTTYDWNFTNYDGRWLGGKAKVKITSTCSSAESGTGKSSGCNTNISKEYSGEMSTTKATSKGIDKNVYVYDKANNRSASPCAKKTIKIDATAPTCEVSAYYGGNTSNTYTGQWLKGDKTVTVSSKCTSDKLSDGSTNGSGCASNDAVTKTYSVEENYILNEERGSAEGGGAYTIVDNVGNTKVCGKIRIKLDYQGPDCNLRTTLNGTTTVYSGAWTNQAVKIQAYCDDASGSGCSTASPYYVYNPNNSVINTSTAGAGGDNGVAKVSDVVGNETKCPNDRKVRIDTQAPTCDIEEKPSNTAAYPPQYLKTNCKDGDGSGCKEPSTDMLEFDSFVELTNQSYSHTYEDKVGNKGVCSTTYNVINVDQKFDQVSCTFKVIYTKDGASGNKSTITVKKPSGITVVSYDNRGVNKATATNADKAINCGKTYNASITVKNANGQTETIACSNTQTTPSCCSSIEWRDGDKNGNKTCSVSCLSGTYNISKFSKLNGQYCNETKSSGGSDCEVSCEVRLCRKDFDRGSNYKKWTRYFSWTWLLDSKKLDATNDTSRYVGYAIGQNSRLTVLKTIYKSGNIDPHWTVKANSCKGDEKKENPRNDKCPGGQCPGYDVSCKGGTSSSYASIYSGCIRKSRLSRSSDCADTCKSNG